MLPMTTIEQVIRQLLARYHGEYALLIGSYARGDATEDSGLLSNCSRKLPIGSAETTFWGRKTVKTEPSP